MVRNEPKENIAKEEKIAKRKSFQRIMPIKKQTIKFTVVNDPTAEKNIQPKRSKPDFSKVKKIETQDLKRKKPQTIQSTESKEVHSL